MWTTENRGRYDRRRLRYPSDLTDKEWNLIEPLIPLAKRGGGKRTVAMREVVNGLMYVLHGLSVARDSQGLAGQEHGLR
jgi:transposase